MDNATMEPYTSIGREWGVQALTKEYPRKRIGVKIQQQHLLGDDAGKAPEPFVRRIRIRPRRGNRSSHGVEERW